MSNTEIFQFIQKKFKSCHRPEREQILCALIRINYGTPWEGDLARLKGFFPDWYHHKLNFGGLNSLVESLSPFSDEPTEVGYADEKEISLLNLTASIAEELTVDLLEEPTQKFADSTLTIKHSF